MQIIKSVAEMAAWSAATIAAGKTIALVPTMGYFHEGHLSLMRHAGLLADFVVVSHFVNPLQFAPGEDLVRYPRDFTRDAAMVSGVGVDVLFAPAPSEMYPPGFQTQIAVEQLTQGLCGKSRPGHFTGVTTVVAKLFHIIQPQSAIFGRKDFQQLSVIRRMVIDLNWAIRIIEHPIVREPDGLAMSSRNIYLAEAERGAAHCLYKAILRARQMVRQGMQDTRAMLLELNGLILAEQAIQVDYVKIVDRFTLDDQTVVDSNSVLLLAVRIGKTRLIDNDVLFEGEAIS